MVSKVKLDILDIEAPESQEPEIGIDHETPPEEEPSGGRWGRGKLLVAGAALFLIISIGITVWYQLGDKPKIREAKSPSAGFAAGDGLEHFDNFTVDFKDERGNYKVLRCDVALELNQGAKLSIEDVSIRRIIYKTLQAKSIESLTVAKGKKALKKELETELDKALGGAKVIKQVYFTRFTLL